MSRTYKDLKVNKVKKLLHKRPVLKKAFKKFKLNGFENDFDNETCPECGGDCEYSHGYFTCEECGWGKFSGSNEDEIFLEYEYENAA